ncbi:MAG: amidohydrolase family protein, partial [Pyrinomonadaceae bacterium]
MLAVVNCSQLITLRGSARPRVGAEMRELGIIEDGAMLVGVDGRIARVGARREIEPFIKDGCEVADAGGRIVLPGFVDAHAHPVFAGTRAGEFEQRAAGATYQEIAQAGGGIRATVRQTRAATDEQLTAAAKRYTEWFLRGG